MMWLFTRFGLQYPCRNSTEKTLSAEYLSKPWWVFAPYRYHVTGEFDPVRFPENLVPFRSVGDTTTFFDRYVCNVVGEDVTIDVSQDGNPMLEWLGQNVSGRFKFLACQRNSWVDGMGSEEDHFFRVSFARKRDLVAFCLMFRVS